MRQCGRIVKRTTASGLKASRGRRSKYAPSSIGITVFRPSLPPRSSIRINSRGGVAAHAGNAAHDSSADDVVRMSGDPFAASLELVGGVKQDRTQRIETERSFARRRRRREHQHDLFEFHPCAGRYNAFGCYPVRASHASESTRTDGDCSSICRRRRGESSAFIEADIESSDADSLPGMLLGAPPSARSRNCLRASSVWVDPRVCAGPAA